MMCDVCSTRENLCDDLGDDPGDNLGKISAISAISVTILGSDDRQPGSAGRFQRVLSVKR